MEVTTHELELILKRRLEEFRFAVSKDMQELLAKKQHQYNEKLYSARNQLQVVISANNHERKKLEEELFKVRQDKAQANEWTYKFCNKGNNEKALRETFDFWKFYLAQQTRKRRNIRYTHNFYKRNLMRKIFKDWQGEIEITHREKSSSKTEKRIQNEVEKALQSTDQELENLRKMAQDLIQDLKNEAESKNNLKILYENALFRGMSALQQESLSVQDISGKLREAFGYTH